MGKRKQTTPVHIEEEKRQQLEWNMLDGKTGDTGRSEVSGSLQIIPDDDPSLHQEAEGANCSAESNGSHDIQSSYMKHLTTTRTDVLDNCCYIVSREVRNFFQSPNQIRLFQQYLEDCTLCLTIYNIPTVKDQEWYAEIGRFSIILQPHPGLEANLDDLPASSVCWLYVSDVQGKHMIYFEDKINRSDSNCAPMFWCVELNVIKPSDLFEGLESKHFQLVHGKYDNMKRELKVVIYARESILMVLSHPSEAFRLKPVHKALQKLMAYFLNIGPLHDVSERCKIKHHDFHQLYEAIMNIQHSQRRQAIVDVQHPNLRPVLRPYQRDAVVWMLQQEFVLSTAASEEPESTCDLHPLYTEVQTACGKTLYYNRHGGSIVKERPVKTKTLPGGILADEMGLGKTVEVLCLILLHQRSPLQLPHHIETQSEDVDTEETAALKFKRKVFEQDERHSARGKALVSVNSASNLASTATVESSGDGRTKINPNDGNDSYASEIPNSVSEDENDSSTATSFEQSELECDSSLSERSESTKITHPDAIETKQTSGQDGVNADKMSIRPKCQPSSWSVTSPDEQQHHHKGAEQADYFSACCTERKQLFECVCGKSKDDSESAQKNRRKKRRQVVECVDCGAQQHAECLNYDLSDPFRGEYKCPHCHVASTPISSGATLIISPSQICDQWVEEIMKHIQDESLSVYVYQGVSRQGFVQPRVLAAQDIVVTTYETLCKELDYVDLPHTNSENGRRFRHPKRFMAIPSPLVAVEWWRVCLDEAQMVERVTAKTAEMAQRLTAINRWCVTGTPLMHSVEDIYGLLLFLGVDPYWVTQWWKTLLWEPFCHGIQQPMHYALSKVLWRTAKKDVINQIALPEQTEDVSWLTFSPIEDHFYRRLYHKCFDQAMTNSSKRTDLSVKLNTLDRKTLSKLLQPLVHLRQACCHPQVVRGEFIPIHDSMLTMEELLESLIKKTRYECEEAHRGKVAALNGLAALLIIQKKPAEAVALYREVLQSVEEHKAELGTDELQQLHAMHNLQEVMATQPPGVAPTLRDHLLTSQCEEVRKKYLMKAETNVTSSKEQLSTLESTVRELQQELEEGSDWWLEVIDWAVERQMSGDIVLWVRNDLADRVSPDFGASILSFRDTASLKYVIDTQLQALESARTALLRDLKKLDKKGGLTPDIVSQTVECCLRPSSQVLKICPFCKVDGLLTTYETKLFSFKEGSVFGFLDIENPTHTVNTIQRGTWADGQVEVVLKSILSFGRTKKVLGENLTFGAVHIKLLDGLKKEFKQLRVLWMALHEHVSAIDELSMATLRLRLRLTDEPRTDRTQVNVLEPTEVEAHQQKLMTDNIVNRGELQKKLGQLIYLKNLAKSQQTMSEGKNPETCPVCQHELGCKWSVLQCGHCYCMDCIDSLLTRVPSFSFRAKALKCPMCREVTPESQVSYVSMQPRAFSDAPNLGASVKGSYSSKVTAVVQCLLNIGKAEPDAKTLVFSTWTDVLDVIGKALEENGITFTSLQGVGNVQRRHLSLFKEKRGLSVLLLPYHSGANGLNLIEATHAILVEPILNPAQEAQAIGRIHRIGQTRPTKIHRFLIRRTIEQRIHTLVESTLRPAAASAETAPSMIDDSMTMGQLTSLFHDSHREEQVDDGGARVQAAGSSRGDAGQSAGASVSVVDNARHDA